MPTDTIPGEEARGLTSQIEIVFGAPVALTREYQLRLVDLIDEICADYEARNPDRIMWSAGIGDKPMDIWSDNPSFDSRVFQIDCAERERYEGERRPKRAAHQSPSRAAGEGLREAVERFIADYDDDDRADAGCGALMEAHIADFRAGLATPHPVTGNDELTGREGLDVRPEVAAFALLMEQQLRANDHKPGWKEELAMDLLPRIREETEELDEATVRLGKQIGWGDAALYLESSRQAVAREAADVGNFAMMVADVCGVLPALAKPTQPASVSGEVTQADRDIGVQVHKSRRGWSSRTVDAMLAGNFDTHDAIQGARLARLAAAPEAATPSAVDRETEERAVAALHPPASVAEGERYLVWSNEHQAWWGRHRCGYTRIIANAGRYDRAEALTIAGTRDGGWLLNKGNPDEIAIPERDAVEQYRQITDEQARAAMPSGEKG